MRRVLAVVAISIGAFGGLVLPRVGSTPDAVQWIESNGGEVLVEERMAAGGTCNRRDEPDSRGPSV